MTRAGRVGDPGILSARREFVPHSWSDPINDTVEFGRELIPLVKAAPSRSIGCRRPAERCQLGPQLYDVDVSLQHCTHGLDQLLIAHRLRQNSGVFEGTAHALAAITRDKDKWNIAAG
jgi:hypothetical protein